MVTHHKCESRSKSLDPVLKAIADPKRRQILDLLARHDMPVGRIAERFNISRPAVVKHLRVLHSARLISVRKSGRERIQCLNTRPLKDVEDWVSRIEKLWDGHLQKLKQQIESEL